LLLLLLPQARVKEAADRRTMKAQNRFMAISFADSNPGEQKELLDFSGPIRVKARLE
jgi:hypothetical protein